jgi:hypothetical protein
MTVCGGIFPGTVSAPALFTLGLHVWRYAGYCDDSDDHLLASGAGIARVAAIGWGLA